MSSRLRNMPFEKEKLLDALYGLIGLGAIVSLKYRYPSIKKFILRKYGSKKKAEIDPQFVEQLALNLPELIRIVTPPPSLISQTTVGAPAADSM
jgi:hypothetical protein